MQYTLNWNDMSDKRFQIPFGFHSNHHITIYLFELIVMDIFAINTKFFTSLPRRDDGEKERIFHFNCHGGTNEKKTNSNHSTVFIWLISM